MGAGSEPPADSSADAAPPARREPPPPAPEIAAEVSDEEIVLRFGDRRWRVRGLSKNLSYELLRVNVLCSQGEGYHVDTFDLYAARHRASFLKQASHELGAEEEVLKRDLGQVLLKLEQLQDKQIKAALKPQEPAPAMSDSEREAALALLRDPQLAERILEDFARCGVVGEETNMLVGYIAAVSRKLEQPLSVLIQSSSAAGKSSLLEAILGFVPEEDRVHYSAITGQALFYMSDMNLKHKILALEEEEGAQRATYALKLLQSEGEVSIATTQKDAVTGEHVTKERRVEGPTSIFTGSSSIDIHEELQNRFLILTVNEGREQTQAIHRRQREDWTREGLLARRARQRVMKRQQNAQRLLEHLGVMILEARVLTFPDEQTRTRRDQPKYLTLIAAIALLFQYQREVRVEEEGGEEVRYVEATLEDIELANRLANEVLGHSLDEMPPHTRWFLEQLEEMVKGGCAREQVGQAEYRFERRDIRAYTKLSLTQVQAHLSRLVELEDVAVHRGGRGQSYVYELRYHGEGKDVRRFVPGLIDVEALRRRRAENARTTANLSASEGDLSG